MSDELKPCPKCHVLPEEKIFHHSPPPPPLVGEDEWKVEVGVMRAFCYVWECPVCHMREWDSDRDNARKYWNRGVRY